MAPFWRMVDSMELLRDELSIAMRAARIRAARSREYSRYLFCFMVTPSPPAFRQTNHGA